MAYTDEQRAYHRAYYRTRRQKIVDFLGGQCAKCGATEGLEVDHVERTQKAFNISCRLTLEAILDELAKCQLLCTIHHREKTGQEQEGFTHGTLYAWSKKKCSCEDCMIAKWEWHDARNARRRSPEGRGPYRTSRETVTS